MSESEIDLQRAIDSICNDFECQWSPENSVDWSAWLSRIDEGAREQLAKHLFEVDVELRQKNGLPLTVKDGRRPGTASDANGGSIGKEIANPASPGRTKANSSSASRNLLFGILALQMDFISREQLVAATSKWLTDKSKLIEEILLEQHALSDDDRDLLLPLVERHIANHDGDATVSLAAVSSLGKLKDELTSLKDSQIDASLATVGVAGYLPPDDDDSVSISALISTESRFRVLRPHAKGGLGEVYVAHDTELHREVALKEIQSRHADDPNSRSRFVLEAEVTGGLEHPGIVPVYGLGKYSNGRPYYAMRFIRGDSLKEAADRFHESPLASKFKTIEFRKLLQRFVDVCNAISYAHSRGVLHRDLKPGNIMLGKYGETLVVDWGLAKVQGREEHEGNGETTLRPSSNSGSNSEPTRVGSAIGTPAFMPPEQASGSLDELGPASDVYSLGATLYYVLTGKRPVDGDDIGDVIRRVKSGEFQAPGLLEPKVPRSLEAICKKAMSVDARDRYSTPKKLADDIERFLADEPVSCRMEPFWVRSGRWLRKHQVLALSIALVSLLIGLFAVAIVLTNQNTRLAISNERALLARQSAEENEQAAVEQKKLAEENASLAREQSQLALATLNGVIFDVQNGLRNLPGSSEIRKGLLKSALEKLGEVSSQFVSASTVDRNTMVTLIELGDFVMEFGTPESEGGTGSESSDRVVELAKAYYTKAERIARRLADAQNAGIEARRDLAVAEDRMGDVLLRAEDREGALQAYQKGLQLSLQLVSDAGDNLDARRDLSVAYAKVGDVHLLQDDLEQAYESFQNCLSLRQQLLAENQDDPVLSRDLASAFDRVGDALLRMKRTEDALDSYRSGLQIVNRLSQLDPLNRQVRLDLSISHDKIGNVYTETGEFSQALSAFETSLRLRSELAADDPGNPKAQRDLALAENKVAHSQYRNQNASAALIMHRSSLEKFKTLSENNPASIQALRDLTLAYAGIGEVLLSLGNRSGALDAYKKILDTDLKLAKQSPGNREFQRGLANSYRKYGDVLAKLERIEESIQAHQQGLAVLTDLNKGSEAEASLRRSLSVFRLKIGDLLLQTGKPEEASEEYRQSLELAIPLAKADPENEQAQLDHFLAQFKSAIASQSLGNWDQATLGYQAAGRVLSQMIEREQSVEFCRKAMVDMQERAAFTTNAALATGEWDELINLPEEVQTGLLELRALEFATNSKRYVEAVQAADRLLESKPTDARQIYNLARVYCIAADNLIPSDESKAAVEKQRLRTEWLGHGVKALESAIQAGWQDDFQSDPDFAVIRELPAFKKLVEVNAANSEPDSAPVPAAEPPSDAGG